MKLIMTSETVTIPENVTLTFNKRVVTVVGPRGTLTRSFDHISIEMTLVSPTLLKLDLWFGKRRQVACVRTLASHICNMIKGVTHGFKYVMKSVYAHFPINISINEDANSLEIRNFLGEKVIRKLQLVEGVTIENTGKDEISLTGNDVEAVACSAARIHHSVLVKNKDIRKFLDGIYVSTKTTVVPIAA